MAIINVLEPNVFNKIAAGEVVERPASVVKELVENSIDAKATQIDINIINGGISLIEITDNGCGIESSEIKKAFLPHATSKILKADDLDNILTLGFRGEALASIASVSEVLMTTKTEEAQSATQISINGGEIAEITQVGAPVGTNIQVKNLFYNIPVRYKFLKKPKQEESAVSEIISRLILANPNIAFKYMADGKIVYQSSGKGEEDALYSVYGANTVSNVIKVDNIIGNMSVKGYIGKPTFSKPNSTYQTIIINGRYVTCKLISTAVGRVYEDYLMTRSYPFFVLYIDMPLDEVDVNVHPNKLEVRFRDQQKIFGVINHIVDYTLVEYKNNSQGTQPIRIQAENIYPQITEQQTNINIPNMILPIQNNMGNYNVQQNDSSLNEIIIDSKMPETTQCNSIANNIENTDILKIEKENTPEPILQRFLFDGMSKNFNLFALKIVGKIFNTFIIVEVEDRVYMIDQHAAHERILFDKLLEVVKRKEFSAQPLLIPYILETNNVEHQFILDNIKNLETLGFDIEEFGNNSFKISTVPYNLPDLQIGVFFNEVLKDMNTILNLNTKDMIINKLAQTACKHAVKGGDDLNKEEIASLLEEIARNNSQLQCPHGRPFVIEITRNDIDKWFKRVL